MADQPFLASNSFNGDGVTVVWEFSFEGLDPEAGPTAKPYITPADVRAELLTGVGESQVTVPVEFTFESANSIRVDPPVPTGTVLRIFRVTENRFPLVNYQDLQSVGASDLDLANRQAVYIVQEARDAARGAGNITAEAIGIAQGAAVTASASAAAAESAAAAAEALAQTASDAAEAALVFSEGLPDAVAPTKGAALVGYKGRTVYDRLGDRVSVMDTPFGASGDGVTSDTAAFTALESAVKGRVVDLGGRDYAVTAVPTGNSYINGNFVVGGFNRPATPMTTILTAAAKCHYYGGQLRKLTERLANPLVQFTGIVFVGDSITWGSGASGTGTSLPARDGTLSDPRSTAGAPSFVNQFKRHIRDNYKRGDGLAEVVTNWPDSSVGESTILYQNIELLYPRYGQFTVAKIGASQDPADLTTNNSPSGIILSLNNTVAGAQYGHSIEFPFSGTRFTLSIRTSSGGALDAFIDVLVNGSPVITALNVQPGFNGLVDDVGNYDQQIEITIPYVKDGTVMIRTNRNGLTGNRLLSVTALRIPRQVRIVNNGIVGLTSVSYAANNLAGNTSGDGVAVTGTDDFVFVQLGTNDRAWTTGRPRGSNQFEVNYNALLDNASFTGKDLILMAANPAGNEDPSVYPFHMQEVRNIIQRVAKARSLDMIDNYSIFSGISNSAYTDDGVHPNDYGHSIIARNIINSLESA